MPDIISIGIDNTELDSIHLLWLDSLDAPCPADMRRFERRSDFQDYWQNVMQRFGCRLRVATSIVFYEEPLAVIDWLAQQDNLRLDFFSQHDGLTAFTVEAIRQNIPSPFRFAYALALCGLYRSQAPVVVTKLIQQTLRLQGQLASVEDTLRRLLHSLPADGEGGRS